MKRCIGIIVGAGLLATCSVWAQAPGAKPDTVPEGAGAKPAFHHPGEIMLGLFHKLNLTPEQKEQIKKVMEQKRDQNKAAQESVMTLRKQLMEQMGSDNPDPEKIRALHRQLGELEGNLAASRAEGLKEIKALLTPEQQAQLAKEVSGAREHLEQARNQWRERLENRAKQEKKTPKPVPAA